jgi:16S rRNA (cytosine1407-C5)-methyltransferase
MDLPEAFITQTQDLLGNEAEDLFAALEKPVPVSLRLNLKKIFGNESGDSPISLSEQIPWSSFGWYLTDRPAFTFDPLLHAGCYYVQEASSMFVEKALRQALKILGETPVRMLDLCAAPGGKSTLSASVLPQGSLLVANELILGRANILAENLIKWGNPDVVVTQSDPSAFSGLTDLFDIILVDVPCSGEGMFRKDSGAITEWSEDNVRLCASRQRDILIHCWPALRPGGFLIYSTCTFNRQENEDNVRWICRELGAKVVLIPTQPEWKITGPLGFTSGNLYSDASNIALADSTEDPFHVYRFLPHKTKGEGFFLALLQKDEGTSYSEKMPKTKSGGNQNKQQTIPDSIRDLLKTPEVYDFYFDRFGRICALRKSHKRVLLQLEEKLRIVHAGIVMGEVKGKGLLPDISLALSTELDMKSVKTCSLDLKHSIDYLRREAFVLPETCPLGWILILFEGHPLGWMKNIGNRANNAYPNEWRIRSENPF